MGVSVRAFVGDSTMTSVLPGRSVLTYRMITGFETSGVCALYSAPETPEVYTSKPDYPESMQNDDDDRPNQQCGQEVRDANLLQVQQR